MPDLPAARSADDVLDRDLPALIAAEQAVLDRVVPALRALQDADTRVEAALVERHQRDHAAWTDARGDRAQREALEEALAAHELHLRTHRAARKARDLPAGTPFFGRLVLEEARQGAAPKFSGSERSLPGGPRPDTVRSDTGNAGGKPQTSRQGGEAGRPAQELLIGKVSVVEAGLRILDWRERTLARLYYAYDEGDEYEEEINGREREGLVAVKRRVDIREGVLVEVQAGETVLRRRPDGGFGPPPVGRAEERDDHRLPDIVSLITREQFEVIARPDAGVVLLRGRAGSGKTTVALHRVAWLHFQDPERFRPDRTLVVMFNKALQTYISRVLPDLGVKGVGVETFHGWAGRMLRQGGIGLGFRADTPAPVARLKRHPAMAALVEAVVDDLAAKTEAWLAERLPADNSDRSVGERTALWRRIRDRWQDHLRDLWALYDDDDLCRRLLPPALHGTLEAARAHQARRRQEGTLDWQDAALLLRLGQLKHRRDPQVACPWVGRYAHIVIDEAQDLSTLEIAVLVDAADAARSVTVAGDPAQKILAEAQFEGFDELLARMTGQMTVRLDALQVGHRSTRPIMALALRAFGREDDPILASARDGDPVEWIEGSEADVLDGIASAVASFREARPGALVAVLCKRKSAADQWAAALGRRRSDVRRAARDDFQFHPGVVVSNVHQVKGLEFDGVVLVEPADFGGHDRHLLHVAITRAAEKLWVAASRGRGVLG